MLARMLLPLALVCMSFNALADSKCDRNSEGRKINCVYIPGWKDPALHITEEDMKGMVYVSPEQKRKMDEKIFKEALENEITARMYYDRVPSRQQAIEDILAGKPRKNR